jgi:hypothetical protein
LISIGGVSVGGLTYKEALEQCNMKDRPVSLVWEPPPKADGSDVFDKIKSSIDGARYAYCIQDILTWWWVTVAPPIQRN